MKSPLFLAFLLGTAAVAVHAAEGDTKSPPTPPAPPTPPQRSQSLLGKYDKNGDGKLDDAELAAMQADRRKTAAEREKELLKKYDKNGDGKLDDAERAARRDDFIKQRRDPVGKAPPALPPKLPPPPPPTPSGTAK